MKARKPTAASAHVGFEPLSPSMGPFSRGLSRRSLITVQWSGLQTLEILLRDQPKASSEFMDLRLCVVCFMMSLPRGKLETLKPSWQILKQQSLKTLEPRTLTSSTRSLTGCPLKSRTAAQPPRQSNPFEFFTSSAVMGRVLKRGAICVHLQVWGHSPHSLYDPPVLCLADSMPQKSLVAVKTNHPGSKRIVPEPPSRTRQL